MFIRGNEVPDNVANLVQMMQGEVLKAFDVCLQQLRPTAGDGAGFGGPTPVARNILTRWFGSCSPEKIQTVQLKVRQMRTTLRNVPLVLLWLPDEHYIGSSHRQWSFPPGMMNGNEAEQVRAIGSVGPGSINYAISLTTHWQRLPNYAMGVPYAWTGADKFEVLVHELSHSIIGTVDATSDKGKIAYGGTRCRQLALGWPEHAINNADNWGFFIEEFHEYASMVKYG